MSAIDRLPEAEEEVWHYVAGGDVTEAMVTGEPVLTLCCCRLHPELSPIAGEGERIHDRGEMPICARCRLMASAQRAAPGHERVTH